MRNYTREERRQAINNLFREANRKLAELEASTLLTETDSPYENYKDKVEVQQLFHDMIEEGGY
jgi:hypothetical protein